MSFACTYVTKEITIDNYETGCETTRNCTLAEPVNLKAQTLLELIKLLNDRYAIDIDDIWIPDPDETSRFSWNRLENSDGDKPTTRQIREWKKGKCRLWLADWDFCIEYRESRAVTEAELLAAGIKWHS